MVGGRKPKDRASSWCAMIGQRKTDPNLGETDSRTDPGLTTYLITKQIACNPIVHIKPIGIHQTADRLRRSRPCRLPDDYFASAQPDNVHMLETEIVKSARFLNDR